MKRCTRCRIIKPNSEFTNKSSRPDRLSCWCKQCCKETGSKYYLEHKDGVVKSHREYYLKNRDKHIARMSKWYQKHPSYNNQYRQKNKDALKTKRIQYIKTHPGQHQASTERRRSQKFYAGGTFSSEEWNQMQAETGNRCVYCYRKFKQMTMDHVVPLSNGGRHDANNIVPACRVCNSHKYNKGLLLFLYYRSQYEAIL